MTVYEMEGFLRGKCLPGDMKVNESNAQYLVRKFSEFESNLSESKREFRAADTTIHNLELKLTDMAVQLANAESKCREMAAENAYIRNRHKELDLLIGKNILVMQAAIIEWQATGDAKNGLAWIYNTLFGPGELPDESEKDAQAYFNRKYAPIDEELMALHKWFWEQSESERAAAGIGVKGE